MDNTVRNIELDEEATFRNLVPGQVVLISTLLGFANIVDSVVRTESGGDIYLKRIYLEGALN